MLVSGLVYSSYLKMKATCSSETPFDLQRTTQHYIPGDRPFITKTVRTSIRIPHFSSTFSRHFSEQNILELRRKLFGVYEKIVTSFYESKRVFFAEFTLFQTSIMAWIHGRSVAASYPHSPVVVFRWLLVRFIRAKILYCFRSVKSWHF
jgi:hypothetical protein